LDFVLRPGGSEVALFVYKKLSSISEDSPYSDIELSLFIEQWPFDVFLSDPVLARVLLGEQELLDIVEISEDLNSASPVHSRRLDNPDILLAVFGGNVLLSISLI